MSDTRLAVAVTIGIRTGQRPLGIPPWIYEPLRRAYLRGQADALASIAKGQKRELALAARGATSTGSGQAKGAEGG